MELFELLLHPVRLRIVHILSSVGESTTTQLAAQMPDVSKVTIYRQIALLVDGFVVEVAGEQRVRGAIERRYRVRPDRPSIDAEASSVMSVTDHQRGFAAAMAVLLAEFDAYLQRGPADPALDGVSYRQVILWASPDEVLEITRRMSDVLQLSIKNEPAPGRAPYLLSPILFPTAPRVPESDQSHRGD